MPHSTTTVFVGIPRSDMLEAYVRVRALALGAEFPAIHTCRVAVEGSEQHGPRHVRLAAATALDAMFAGATVGVGVRSGDLYMLIDRAFEHMHAQLTSRAASSRAAHRPGGPLRAASLGPSLRKASEVVARPHDEPAERVALAAE